MRRHIVRWLILLSALSFLFASPTQVTGARAAGMHAVAPKLITISIYRQRLRAWDGDRVVLTTPVTTGNPDLPTPTGHYAIFAKYSPFTFVSPWPPGSPFWYPNSEVSFAMEFIRGGYFIHDAPWRSAFGPGTDRAGQPGTNYGGTHGCVNVPYWAARFLYFWAPIGTPVHVVP